MPDKEETQQFIDDKVLVTELIDELMGRLEECISLGMSDDNSVIYNELYSLKEETEAADSYYILSEIIHHSKQVEKNLDTWLSSMGKITQDLNWPDASSEF